MFTWLKNRLIDWLYFHRFRRTCSKAMYLNVIESQIRIPRFVSRNVYYKIDKIISDVSGWKYGTPPSIKIEIRKGGFPFTRDIIYKYIDNCYDYWISKKK